MDELMVSLSTMASEDRDMVTEALIIAARRWRRQAADARLAEEMGSLDWRVKKIIESKCEKEEE